MSVDPDLARLLKRLKLGPLLPTLPERLTLARAQQLDYVAFLTLLLADEVQRRDQQALERRLLGAGFEDRVTLDDVDWASPVNLDRRQLQQLFSLDFLARHEARFEKHPRLALQVKNLRRLDAEQRRRIQIQAEQLRAHDGQPV